MIAIGKGAKVFLPGEWNGSVRSAAVYQARKLGGTPKVKGVDARRRNDRVDIVGIDRQSEFEKAPRLCENIWSNTLVEPS